MKILFLLNIKRRKFDPNNDQVFQSKLDDLFNYAKIKHDVDLYISFIESYNRQQQLFSEAFYQKDSSWKIEKLLRPDVVYDQTSYFLEESLLEVRKEIATIFPLLNPLELSRILTDKWETFLALPSFHPKTILFQEGDSLQKLDEIHSPLVIIKPRDGLGGNGIVVSSKKDFRPIKEPFIVQELIETNHGIPGIVRGRHDLRVLMDNKTPFYSFVRSPLEGDYIANIKRGGNLNVIPIEKIPQSALVLVEHISDVLSRFPKKLYAIDLMFDEAQRPWIVECNSRPGLILHKNELPYREYFYTHIIQFLTNSI